MGNTCTYVSTCLKLFSFILKFRVLVLPINFGVINTKIITILRDLGVCSIILKFQPVEQ